VFFNNITCSTIFEIGANYTNVELHSRKFQVVGGLVTDACCLENQFKQQKTHDKCKKLAKMAMTDYN
jgi:hypothetical protein